MEDNKINLTGKIAKFPNDVKAVTAFKYLQNIKVNPDKLWYILIENQGNELKMVKYNQKDTTSLIKYTSALKDYYFKYYENNNLILESLNKIEIVGENDFSIIKNIPNIQLNENETLLCKITQDLIKLLAN
jgi:hypothetical protein